MSGKPVIPRELARRDVEQALDHYLAEAGRDAALGFVEALRQAYRLIGDHAGAGSSRHAHELALPGLRSLMLRGYPYLVFYLERETHVDVWRVLHARRDIPAWLGEP